MGGGPVALRRTRTLLDAGLQVTVIAPDLLPEFAELPVTSERRRFQDSDLQGVRLVVAATNQPEVNDGVAQAALQAGLLVNHAGAAERGNLRFPARAERAGVQVAVSTGQELPMLAKALAARIAPLLPSAEQVSAWQQQRAKALTLPNQERELALLALKNDIQSSLRQSSLGGAA